MLMPPLDRFLPTLQFTPNLHFYQSLENVLPTNIWKKSEYTFINFQENIPPTLLFGPTFLFIFKNFPSCTIRTYSCIWNTRVCKTTLQVTYYKDNLQKFHHELILGMLKMQALTPILNKISNSCQNVTAHKQQNPLHKQSEKSCICFYVLELVKIHYFM